MTEKEDEMFDAVFDAYKVETEKMFDLAQHLDILFPETPNSFMGSPSDRVLRQLKNLNIIGKSFQFK